MHLYHALTLAGSLAATATAITQRFPEGNAFFTVPRVRKDSVTPNGPAAYSHAFRKHGLAVPDVEPEVQLKIGVAGSRIGLAGPQVGSVPAVPEEYHSEYLSPVTIGGNQTFQMDFDTGSSDFWVFSTYLSQAAIQGHTAFDPNMSTTFVSMPRQHWRIRYGDGTGAAGLVGKDKVEIGGATVTRQAIEMATAISSAFSADEDNDGLVGLGFSSINSVTPNKQKTWFDNVKRSLRQPLFTVDIREDGTGSYTFGNIPAGSYSGPITKVAINDTQGYWQFPSSVFAVGANLTERADASPAIADTGTSLLIVDSEVALSWYRQIEGAGYSTLAGGYVFPCTSALPSFSLSIGQVMVTIPVSLLNYAQLDATYCYGALQSNGGYDLQIYGDVLFRAGLFVFYGTPGAPMLGVAQKAGTAVGLVSNTVPVATVLSSSVTRSPVHTSATVVVPGSAAAAPTSATAAVSSTIAAVSSLAAVSSFPTAAVPTSAVVPSSMTVAKSSTSAPAPPAYTPPSYKFSF